MAGRGLPPPFPAPLALDAEDGPKHARAGALRPRLPSPGPKRRRSASMPSLALADGRPSPQDKVALVAILAAACAACLALVLVTRPGADRLGKLAVPAWRAGQQAAALAAAGQQAVAGLAAAGQHAVVGVATAGQHAASGLLQQRGSAPQPAESDSVGSDNSTTEVYTGDEPTLQVGDSC